MAPSLRGRPLMICMGGWRKSRKKNSKALLQGKKSQRPSSRKKNLKGPYSGKKKLKLLLRVNKISKSPPGKKFKMTSWKKNSKGLAEEKKSKKAFPGKTKIQKRLLWGRKRFASDIFSTPQIINGWSLIIGWFSHNTRHIPLRVCVSL